MTPTKIVMRARVIVCAYVLNCQIFIKNIFKFKKKFTILYCCNKLIFIFAMSKKRVDKISFPVK